MKTKTFLQMMKNGQGRLLLQTLKLIPQFYRISWLAAAARHGLLRSLNDGPKSFDELAREMALKPEHRYALESWLQIGVRLREISVGAGGYRLGGFLAKTLGNVEMDAYVAFFEEMVILHHKLILETPEKLKRGELWPINDQNGDIVARSSRVLEPVGFEAVDAVVNASVQQRLLEIGAGSGTYIRYAVENHPTLTALGLDLQSDVVKTANANLEKWGIAHRAHVEHCDIRDYKSNEKYDIVTLHNNIYYFPVNQWLDVLRHVASFVSEGGKLLVTTACRGGSIGTQLMDLFCASTEGCGRLPDVTELRSRLLEAGFTYVYKKSLVPGEDYYMFIATK